MPRMRAIKYTMARSWLFSKDPTPLACAGRNRRPDRSLPLALLPLADMVAAVVPIEAAVTAIASGFEGALVAILGGAHALGKGALAAAAPIAVMRSRPACAEIELRVGVPEPDSSCLVYGPAGV